MSKMLTVVLALALADRGGPPATAPKLKAEAAPATLQGRWQAAGKEHTGKEYEAEVAITYDKDNDRYIVEWSMGGGLHIVGVGLVADGKLVVGWSCVTALQHKRGVSIYRIGKELDGRWSMVPGKGGVERLTRTIDNTDTEEGK